MLREINKYHLKFAWFPKIMYNGHKVWFENYYEAHITLPIIHEFGVFYSNRRISSVDYMIEVIRVIS